MYVYVNRFIRQMWTAFLNIFFLSDYGPDDGITRKSRVTLKFYIDIDSILNIFMYLRLEIIIKLLS